MIKELTKNYKQKCTFTKAVAEGLEADIQWHTNKIRMYKQKIATHRKTINALKKDLESLFIPDWKKEVLEPLAAELERRTGKKALLLGPCGIGCKLRIVLMDNPQTSWVDQDTLELVVSPDFENDQLVFNYETGEVCDEYARGTLGALNGLNNVEARFPDSVDEILRLFKFHPRISLLSELTEQYERKWKQELSACPDEVPTVDWFKEVVRTLANELERQTRKTALIAGPFGDEARVGIVLINDPKKDLFEQDRLVLTLIPKIESGRIVFYYATMKGSNPTTALLPDCLDEILSLFRFTPKTN